MKVFSIDGYWKDDKDNFYGYLVSEFDDVPKGYSEEDIFFFGLSEDELEEAISLGEDTVHDFVITNYEEIV